MADSARLRKMGAKLAEHPTICRRNPPVTARAAKRDNLFFMFIRPIRLSSRHATCVAEVRGAASAPVAHIVAVAAAQRRPQRVAAPKDLRSPNAGERTDELLGKNSHAGPGGLIRAPAWNRARGIDLIVWHVREEEAE